MLCLEAGPSSVGLLRSFGPGFPATLRSWWSHVGAVPKLSPSPQTSSRGTETRNRWTETICAEYQNNAVVWVSVPIRFLNLGGKTLCVTFDMYLRTPLVRLLEWRRWFGRYHEDCPHGVDLAIGSFTFGHLQRGDTQTPDVSHTVVPDFLDHLYRSQTGMVNCAILTWFSQ